MRPDLKKLQIQNVKDFNPDHIFDCGQCFRWNREDDGSYSGIVAASFANVSYKANPGSGGGTVTIWSGIHPENSVLREKFWFNYFDLGRDYGMIKRMLTTEDPVMEKAIRTAGGIRILNQSKWETLISFIVSQNNNIPRIKSCLEALCRAHGRLIGTREDRTLHAFPSLDKLSVLKESDLEVCRLGYRAKYITETARKVAYDGGAFLETGDRMPTAKIEQYLLGLPGVGPKVANCIMLFSMRKSAVFPIDVWVRRVMSGFYGMAEHNMASMKDYALKNFGEYGGIAQQYLFYYVRELKKNDPDAYAALRLEEPEEELEKPADF